MHTVPTLSDVAKKGAVSTATISRCLNKPDHVKDSTRRKVKKASDALGYTPISGARVITAKRTKTVGAIFPTMENAIFERRLQAFHDELSFELGAPIRCF